MHAREIKGTRIERRLIKSIHGMRMQDLEAWREITDVEDSLRRLIDLLLHLL